MSYNSETEKLSCSGCGKTVPIWEAIDRWVLYQGGSYCKPCQKKMKIGWYEKTPTDPKVKTSNAASVPIIHKVVFAIIILAILYSIFR